MTRRTVRIILTSVIACAALISAPAAAFAQSTHLLIVVGLAGDPEHGELFDKWAKALAAVAADRLGVPKEQIQTLSGDAATRAAVTHALTSLQAAGPDDTVGVTTVGDHG